MIINVTLTNEDGNVSFDKFLNMADKQGWKLINMGVEKIPIVQESDKQ